MPLAAETPLFSPGGRVTLTALKWSGTSVTVGSLAAATTVRVIADGAGVVCAVPEAGSAIAPSNSSPVVLNCMIASQVQRIIQAPYALPAPLGMAGRFELLLDGNREQRPSETEFVAVGVIEVEEALTHSASRGAVAGWYPAASARS